MSVDGSLEVRDQIASTQMAFESFAETYFRNDLPRAEIIAARNQLGDALLEFGINVLCLTHNNDQIPRWNVLKRRRREQSIGIYRAFLERLHADDWDKDHRGNMHEEIDTKLFLVIIKFNLLKRLPPPIVAELAAAKGINNEPLNHQTHIYNSMQLAKKGNHHFFIKIAYLHHIVANIISQNVDGISYEYITESFISFYDISRFIQTVICRQRTFDRLEGIPIEDVRNYLRQSKLDNPYLKAIAHEILTGSMLPDYSYLRTYMEQYRKHIDNASHIELTFDGRYRGIGDFISGTLPFVIRLCTLHPEKYFYIRRHSSLDIVSKLPANLKVLEKPEDENIIDLRMSLWPSIDFNLEPYRQCLLSKGDSQIHPEYRIKPDKGGPIKLPALSLLPRTKLHEYRITQISVHILKALYPDRGVDSIDLSTQFSLIPEILLIEPDEQTVVISHESGSFGGSKSFNAPFIMYMVNTLTRRGYKVKIIVPDITRAKLKNPSLRTYGMIHRDVTFFSGNLQDVTKLIASAGIYIGPDNGLLHIAYLVNNQRKGKKTKLHKIYSDSIKEVGEAIRFWDLPESDVCQHVLSVPPNQATIIHAHQIMSEI